MASGYLCLCSIHDKTGTDPGSLEARVSKVSLQRKPAKKACKKSLFEPSPCLTDALSYGQGPPTYNASTPVALRWAKAMCHCIKGEEGSRKRHGVHWRMIEHPHSLADYGTVHICATIVRAGITHVLSQTPLCHRKRRNIVRLFSERYHFIEMHRTQLLQA